MQQRIAKRIRELAELEYAICKERISIREYCQHEFKFAFEEKYNSEDFGWTNHPTTTRHFECTICGQKKTEQI